jgi:hypothetical protein
MFGHFGAPATPLTQHLAAAGATQSKLAATIAICRPCHNAVHGLCDNKTLAEEFSTLAALLAHEKIHAFVGWASKQASRPKSLSGGKMLQQKR